MTDLIAQRLGLNEKESGKIRFFASNIQFTAESVSYYGRHEYEKFLKSTLNQGWDTDAFNGLLIKIAVLEYWIANNDNNTEIAAMARMRLHDLTQLFVRLSAQLQPFFEKVKSLDIKKECVDGYKKSKGSLVKAIGIYWLKFFGLSATTTTVIATLLSLVEHRVPLGILIISLISMLIASLITMFLMYLEYLDKASTAKSIGIETKRVYEASYLLKISLLASLTPAQVLDHEFQAVFRKEKKG